MLKKWEQQIVLYVFRFEFFLDCWWLSISTYALDSNIRPQAEIKVYDAEFVLRTSVTVFEQLNDGLRTSWNWCCRNADYILSYQHPFQLITTQLITTSEKTYPKPKQFVIFNLFRWWICISGVIFLQPNFSKLKIYVKMFTNNYIKKGSKWRFKKNIF